MTIKIDSLRYSVNGSELLHLDSFELRRDECLLLTGDNGSGKSTLLRILAGLQEPDSGRFNLSGQEFDFARARPHLLSETVYLHQTPYIFDTSVKENLRYGLRCQRVDKSEEAERVDQALQWAGLSLMQDRNARRLSGGERQRLALARARILEPNFLLLDEPTAGLDAKSRSRTLKLIADLASSNVGVLLTSHQLTETLPYVSRHLVLLDGGIQEQVQAQ